MKGEAALRYIRETEQETRKFRLLALILAIAGLYILRGRTLADPLSLLLLLALAFVYLAYALVLATLILPRVRTPYVVYGLIAVDTLALGSAIFLAGTVNTALIVLIPVLVLYYSIFFGYASALWASTLFAFMFVGLDVHFAAQATGSFSDVQIEPTTPVQVMSFYLLALLGGYLARRRLEERQEKEDLQEIIRAQNRARGLLEVAQTLSGSLAVDDILQGLVKDIPGILGVRSSAVALLDEERNVLQVQAIASEHPAFNVHQLKGTAFAPAAGSVTAQVLETGRMVTLSDVQPVDPRLPPWVRVLGSCALLAIPLLARDKRLGVVYLFDTVNPARSFSEDEKAIAQSYCHLAANAIANAMIHRAAEGRISRLLGDLETTIERMERLKETRKRTELIVGDLRIDTVQSRVTLAGQPVSLSPTEFEVLYLLAENAGRPLNTDTLLRRAWGETYSGQTNVVDVCIHRLRRKLGRKGGGRILTIRGVGYMVDTGVASSSASQGNAATASGEGKR
ncbi:MAG: winged helix-turn-helix domain-containing protein [Chloroflexi bacterium]|nr:winged helix-turn-helix domain-containing protein [Chloroflexota bacterium]